MMGGEGDIGCVRYDHSYQPGALLLLSLSPLMDGHQAFIRRRLFTPLISPPPDAAQ
jgi:hypothetical protein